MDRKDKHQDRPPHTGSTSPANEELSTWLAQLWERGELPERLELFQVYGRALRGRMIHERNFKANSPLNPEEANRLANEIVAACQHDCDSSDTKRAFYEVTIIDPNRRAEPLVRRIGPFRQKIAYFEQEGDSLHDEDDEGGVPGAKPMTLRYVELLIRRVEKKEDSLYLVIGQLLKMQQEMILSGQQRSQILEQSNMDNFLKTQDALDRRKERDIAGAWDEMKIEAARDTYRTGRTLLTGLIGAASSGVPPKQVTKAIVDNMKMQIDRNSERTLVDIFLRDCEKEGIFTQLFGEWTPDGPPAPGKEGIFTPQQCAILIRVRDGDLPPESIDEIIYGFGGKYEITGEQLARAQPFIPDGIGRSIVEIKELRERKRAKTQLQQEPSPETK